MSSHLPMSPHHPCVSQVPRWLSVGLAIVLLSTLAVTDSRATLSISSSSKTVPQRQSAFAELFVTKNQQLSLLLSNWLAPLTAPTVTLASPTNNSVFIAGSNIVFGANAADPDGTINRVEFFQGTVKLGEDLTAPYSFEWTNVTVGDYVLTARATDNLGETSTSSAVNVTAIAQAKQYVNWSSITNGADLGNGSVRKTSTGAWDFSASALQTLQPGDGYFESTASTYNQSINIVGNGAERTIIIGSGGWVGIYENGQEVAATSSNQGVPIISGHNAGDRYRLEITNSILRYIRYRAGTREVLFTSVATLPAYPLSLGVGASSQNAEWQKTVLAQLNRKLTWLSIVNGTDLGNGSVRKTSTGVWDFSAGATQTLVRGDGYFESTASYYNQSFNVGGSDGGSRSLVLGTGGWAAIYENGQEVASTSPLGNLAGHMAGDRYRFEIANGVLTYIRYRSGVRSVIYTSTNLLPAYPLSLSLGASFLNSEWQNTVCSQLSHSVSWTSITNGIDLGNGSVRKTSSGGSFSALARQQLVFGGGYFEATASSYQQSIYLGGTAGDGAVVMGTGGWAGIYEMGQEVANTYPNQNFAAHSSGDRYRLEVNRNKLRYVRYRAGARSLLFTSNNPMPASPIWYGVGLAWQNTEWQSSIFSDNLSEHNDSAFVSQTVPATMVPGQNYSVSVTMRNTGASTWTPEGDYQLASENLPDNTRWGLSRVNLNTTVPPGSNAIFNFTVTAPATGSHSFRWRMVQQGVERFGALSTNVNVQTVNGAPSVSLTSPSNNSVFTAGATVALTATASDSDGTITKVEFFQGTVKLGEDTTSPYAYTWSNVPAGSYVLTARATDNGGATTTSSSVNIVVNAPNQAPTVSITAPSNNAIFTAPAIVEITASAADSDGVISKVEFFQGPTKLGEDLTAPYIFSWSNVSAGTYTLTARATDNLGATGTSSIVNITVNQPPAVSLTAPANNSVFHAPATVSLTASASDSDGSISKVEFFQGVTKLGEDLSAPYSYSWVNVSAGSYSLTARATDNNGATTTSSAVSIIVNQPPSASLTAPSNNAVFHAPATVGITASASDADGSISKVEFFQGATKLGEDLSAPYSYNWTNISAGTYSLTARATDNNGATTTSSAVSIIVNQPPSASLTAPSNNAVFHAPAAVSLTASASDSDGSISKVEFFQGATKLGEDLSAPYSYNWTNISAGTYSLTARATDNNGATTTSSAVSIIVNQPPIANAGGPYVGFTGSAIQLNAGSSTDSDGTIASYEWNFGDTTNGSGVSPTHSYTAAGNYTVTLTVTDNHGALALATATVTITSSANQRLDPLNRTGGGGEDPLSRNFNWSLPLVALSGRAGMDLDLSLTYNSLVWTRSGSFISFDEDKGFPSPGFRLGFPVIQSTYFNSEVGKNAFLLIMPDGGRVELRQVGTSSLYEAVDSSHLLLDSSTMVLRTTDGTQLTYVWKGVDFQCIQVKDRNGNFITVNYTAFGRIDTVVDTLSRTIKFNYDGNQRLTSITQTWTIAGTPTTHTWASFTYSNPDLPIYTNFSELTVLGPQNGSTLKVLTRVTLADNSRFDFDYTSWGQVWKVSHFAVDGHLRNYRAYNLPLDDNVAQPDCPKFSERRDWARDWNRSGVNGASGLPVGPEQEAITSYTLTTNQSWTLPDGTQQTGLVVQVTAPDFTYGKIYFAGAPGTSTGWQRGLPSLVEAFDSSGVRQKQSVTKWTQDDINLSYIMNPRLSETNIYDPAGNRTRTTIDYQTANLPDGTTCHLPQDIKEYQANATTVLRRTHTDYNLNVTYTSRRIIGLIREKTLYQVDPGNQSETLMSQIGFEYDDEESILGNDGPVQHDNNNYGASFVAGRANLSTVKRFNVSNTSVFTPRTIKYNTAGAVVRTSDADSHTVNISYADAFAANGTNLDPALSFSTLAYPTSVTDADGYSATTHYHYDLGAVTWKQTPQPNEITNTPGPQQKVVYDNIGRVERITNLVNGAYTRFVYGPNYTESWATVDDPVDEAYTLQVFDGAGRAIAKASNHPGSVGGFSAQLMKYDAMGRVVKQSNPSETSIQTTGVFSPYNWQTTGDDAAAGWLYTQQSYDWQGRPLVTTYPSITNNPNETTTKEASYSGCGCAGGQVVALTDEGTMDGGVIKRRQKKIYADVLGRTVKTEILHWQGGSIYSATVNTYNARDQVTRIRQFAGAAPADLNDPSCPTGTCQDITMTYDGYSRLQTRHVPEQDASTATVYTYNADDTLHSVTDARGAITTYGYNNNRHLVTSVNYSAPPGITATAPVTFVYDAAGNRVSMTDGLGSQTYTYNQLSQLMSETRIFTGVGSFELGYDYNLAGQLKKITEHSSNMTIRYGYDSSGRVNGVTGEDNLFMGITTYASDFAYRAWGGLKAMKNGDNQTSSFLHNSKLQPTRFEWNGHIQAYTYSNDGRVSSVDHTDEKFDRAYTYDHAARLISARSGGQARGDTGVSPYDEIFSYDSWNNLTSRQTTSWDQDQLFDAASYTKNRRSGWGYDADGRNTTLGSRTYTFDAAGRQTLMTGQQWVINHYININQSSGHDGDGRKVKEASAGVTTYYLRSSILGGSIIAEINSNAQKSVGYVFSPTGQLLARQVPAGQNSYIVWKHSTPARTTQLDFAVGGGFGSGGLQRVELDPLGASVPLEYVAPPENQGQGDIGPGGSGVTDARWGNFFDLSAGCLSYAMASCSGPMEKSNAEAEMRAHFGDDWFNLPGHFNSRMQEEERYEWLFISGSGYDPAFDRGYLPDGGYVDLDHNIVTVYAGAEYFVQQNPNDRKINNAFADASTAISRKRTKKKDPCTDFFTQGRTLKEVSAIFANFWKSAVHDPKLAATASTANSGQGMASSVRLGNAFFADDDTTAGTGLSWSFANNIYLTDAHQLSPRQNRALTILHEFAHALGLIPSDNPTVDPSGKQSTANDATIYKNCGHILDLLPLRD